MNGSMPARLVALYVLGLGGVLWALVVKGANPRLIPLACVLTVVAAIIHKQAPSLAQSLSEAPAELERIVQKALAKDREQRYQNARDLQIDLQALKQETELSARLARSVRVPGQRGQGRPEPAEAGRAGARPDGGGGV